MSASTPGTTTPSLEDYLGLWKAHTIEPSGPDAITKAHEAAAAIERLVTS